MRDWIRLPVVQFVGLGALLFLASAWLGRATPGQDTIVVTERDVQLLAERFRMTWQRPPDAAELENLIEAHIRQEVLYRQALAMGLDSDDQIVRQRLVQKLEFMAEDVASQAPSDAALQELLQSEPERYRLPARLSFRHVYVNGDRHGDATEATATALLEQLRRLPAGQDPGELGDRLMLPAELVQRSTPDIDQLFGAGFAAQLEGMAVDVWSGPVVSGYGLHLVKVSDRVEGRMPALDEVRDRLAADYVNQRRTEAKDSFYQSLRAGYRVVVEQDGASARAGAGEGPAR